MSEAKVLDNIPEIRRYVRGDPIYVQAQRIWVILVAFVSTPLRDTDDRRIILYGDVAELMGYPDRRAGHTLGRQLGIIGEYCRLNDLPTLNSIVVIEKTLEPGDEVLLRDGRSIPDEQRDVMREDWFALGVPSTATLRKAWHSLKMRIG
jgi:hypothetical protein